MENHKKIAVIGGTGKAGKHIILQLINKGYKVKALVRNPDQAAINNPSIEIVQGDATKYESVYALIKECDAVINAIGQTKGEKPVHSISSLNIIKAMNDIGIKRYIIITGLSIDTPFDSKSFKNKLISRIMKFSFPSVIADKQNEYSLISESKLDWTIIRIPLLEQKVINEDVKISLTDCPGKRISAGNLALFISNQVFNDGYIRDSPFVSN